MLIAVARYTFDSVVVDAMPCISMSASWRVPVASFGYLGDAVRDVLALSGSLLCELLVHPTRPQPRRGGCEQRI